MSFPIIEKLGGQEKVMTILRKAGHPVDPDAIRMWHVRKMSDRAELILLRAAIRLGVEQTESDFINQPEDTNNG